MPVELKLIRRDDMRPPLADLVVDLVLRNQEPRDRWFLLPASVGPNADAIGSAGVSSAEIASRSGILVGRFSGNAPFDALPIPAHDEVTLQDWPLRLWDDPPVSEVDVEVVTAADLRIGGTPASEWFKTLGSWISDDLAALPVELVDARRERVRVRL